MADFNFSEHYYVPLGRSVNLILGPVNIYRPKPSHNLGLNLTGLYQAPIGSEVNFNFGVTEPPAEKFGYIPSTNLKLIRDGYIPTADLPISATEKPTDGDGIPTPTVKVTPFKTGWGIAEPVSSNFCNPLTKARTADIDFSIKSGVPINIDSVRLLTQKYKINQIDKPYLLKKSDTFDRQVIDINLASERVIKPIDKPYLFVIGHKFRELETNAVTKWAKPQEKDLEVNAKWNKVALYGVPRIPIYSSEKVGYLQNANLELDIQPYIPKTNLEIVSLAQPKVIWVEYDKPKNFEVDFNLTELLPNAARTFADLSLGNSKLIYPERIVTGYKKTPIQPEGLNTLIKYQKPVNIENNTQSFKWGYGLNNFIIGGQWREGFKIEPPEPPKEPVKHKDPEVYRIVNIVNITAVPNGEIINFDNFTITRDIDSFAWTASFDILDKASFSLVKPQGRVLKEVDININGEKFRVFIGKTSTGTRATKDKGAVTVFKVTGWSRTRFLSDPYSGKKSYTNPTEKPAAGLVNDELVGTGFTAEWKTVNWAVPAGIHSYQSKTPLGAILSLVNAAGGVITPAKTGDSFEIKPYYPVSPWHWLDQDTAVDRTMYESQFFSIDVDAVPKDNPDGVYVYGEEKGVGVKAIRQGKPGTALLPDIVDRYITTNTVGQERGRIEVAKNSYIEKIPMTTYIDENGIIMPQELIEFTDLDGQKWRGMVSQTTIVCSRVGTALMQKITVDRYYE